MPAQRIAKQIDLRVEAASSARVYGNARRLTLIFGNLLDNALRYTPLADTSVFVRPLRAQLHVVEVWMRAVDCRLRSSSGCLSGSTGAR